MEGTIPEWVEGTVRSITVTNTRRPWGPLVFVMAIFVITVLTMVGVAVIFSRTWSTGGILGYLIPSIVLSLFLIFIFLMTWYIHYAVYQSLATEFVLDADRIWAVRKGRTVRELAFRRETRLDLNVPPDGSPEDFRAYEFMNGWRMISLTASKEDLESLWHVVLAAAWKHRMAIGHTFVELLEKEKRRLDPPKRPELHLYSALGDVR